nr:basic proline-rich protein-like [Equus asinus]
MNLSQNSPCQAQKLPKPKFPIRPTSQAAVTHTKPSSPKPLQGRAQDSASLEAAALTPTRELRDGTQPSLPTARARQGARPSDPVSPLHARRGGAPAPRRQRAPQPKFEGRTLVPAFGTLPRSLRPPTATTTGKRAAAPDQRGAHGPPHSPPASAAPGGRVRARPQDRRRGPGQRRAPPEPCVPSAEKQARLSGVTAPPARLTRRRPGRGEREEAPRGKRSASLCPAPPARSPPPPRRPRTPHSPPPAGAPAPARPARPAHLRQPLQGRAQDSASLEAAALTPTRELRDGSEPSPDSADPVSPLRARRGGAPAPRRQRAPQPKFEGRTLVPAFGTLPRSPAADGDHDGEHGGCARPEGRPRATAQSSGLSRPGRTSPSPAPRQTPGSWQRRAPPEPCVPSAEKQARWSLGTPGTTHAAAGPRGAGGGAPRPTGAPPFVPRRPRAPRRAAPRTPHGPPPAGAPAPARPARPAHLRQVLVVEQMGLARLEAVLTLALVEDVGLELPARVLLGRRHGRAAAAQAPRPGQARRAARRTRRGGRRRRQHARRRAGRSARAPPHAPRPAASHRAARGRGLAGAGTRAPPIAWRPRARGLTEREVPAARPHGRRAPAAGPWTRPARPPPHAFRPPPPPGLAAPGRCRRRCPRRRAAAATGSGAAGALRAARGGGGPRPGDRRPCRPMAAARPANKGSPRPMGARGGTKGSRVQAGESVIRDTAPTARHPFVICHECCLRPFAHGPDVITPHTQPVWSPFL